MKNLRHELGYTHQMVEIGRTQRRASAMEKHGLLKEQQVAHRARVLATLALMSSNSGNKRMEFANKDFNAAINIIRCAVLETRPDELTRANFVGQLLRLEVYGEKLIPKASRRSKKIRRRLLVSTYIYLHGRETFSLFHEQCIYIDYYATSFFIGLLTSSCRKLTKLATSNQHRFYSKDQSLLFLFIAIDEAERNSSMKYPTGNAFRSTHCLLFHGKGPWTRNSGITAIASCAERITALHEVSVHGSNFLECFSSLDFLPGTCSLMGNVAFNKSSIQLYSIRLRVQQTESLSKRSSRRLPSSKRLGLGTETEAGIDASPRYLSCTELWSKSSRTTGGSSTQNV